jgi:diguanylate cyclase (GGDEF)-like protein
MDDPAPGTPALRARLRALARLVRRAFLRPQMIAFLPALLLAGVWFGGQGVLLIVALTLPLVLALVGLFERRAPERDAATGLVTQDVFVEEIDRALGAERTGPGALIVVALEIDEAEELAARMGEPALESVIRATADRLLSAVRGQDVVARLGPHRFGVLLAPVRDAGLDIALSTVERLQAEASEPVSVDAARVHVTLSAGFCLERRAPRRSGPAMRDAALSALAEARAAGGGAARAFAGGAEAGCRAEPGDAAALRDALEAGELRPWFQPQVDARTGEVTGMEALARWEHPARGVVPPSEFLPLAEAAGLMERLGETMLHHALAALRDWETAGLHLPRVAVNMSGAELRNPRLARRVQWDLDRFDISAARLTVEVLETVVAATSDDTITANLVTLSRAGCGIDLDDFGTGAAAIGNVRRFGVSRVKIDRAYVTRVDTDREQQKMVAAIVAMARTLEIETVAEGVETEGERRMLAELGCDHLQGFHVARPMPAEAAARWLAEAGATARAGANGTRAAG